MVHSPQHFTGLGMPVFTAFGWAGEETAIKYALSQLELFIGALHNTLPHKIQAELPFFGLNSASQGVYLASTENLEDDVHIAFYARPTSLELQLAITNKAILGKGLSRVVKKIPDIHHLITKLGPDWSLRIQQMQIDESSGVATNYQDLFKDSVRIFDEKKAEEIFNRALYLNSDEQWVTPIYLSLRINSEHISVMGKKVLDVVREHIEALTPIFMMLSGRVEKKPKKAAKARTKTAASSETIKATELVSVEDTDNAFHYTTQLKPLHIRRGFVNMTAQHWPFFALNARTTTRDVTVYYDGIYDKKSTVWRLQPSNQARLVLSPSLQIWLENNFQPNDQIKVSARKLSGDEIQISLAPVE